MAVTTIKAGKVVDTALALLIRETALLNTIWRNPVGSVRYAANDTVSIKLPAYVASRTNNLRSGAARTKDSLFERKVDVVLNKRAYIDIEITDEVFTLDIMDFNRQVVAPVVRGLAAGAEQAVADQMAGTTTSTALTLVDADPYSTLVDARSALNNASVPMTDRFCVVGTDIEAKILKSDRLAKYDQSGSAGALRDASIGRMAGFEVLVSSYLPANLGFCYHRTAFSMTTEVPEVPAGAPWGERRTADGLAMRMIQVMDPDTYNNILASEFWYGTATTTDRGALSGGKFIPAVDPAEVGATDMVVRAVKITDAV